MKLRIALVAMVFGLIQIGSAPTADAGIFDHCFSCCNDCCTCEPQPVPVTVCITDPCTCCVKQVTVCVPPCCLGQQPVVNVRKGIMGRSVHTLCWPCCGHKETAVITVCGDVRVR